MERVMGGSYEKQNEISLKKNRELVRAADKAISELKENAGIPKTKTRKAFIKAKANNSIFQFLFTRECESWEHFFRLYFEYLEHQFKIKEDIVEILIFQPLPD